MTLLQPIDKIIKQRCVVPLVSSDNLQHACTTAIVSTTEIKRYKHNCTLLQRFTTTGIKMFDNVPTAEPLKQKGTHQFYRPFEQNLARTTIHKPQILVFADDGTC